MEESWDEWEGSNEWEVIHEKMGEKIREIQTEDCGCVVQRSGENGIKGKKVKVKT